MPQADLEPVASPVGGYVLAGGRSSRMGTDKALQPLAGKPLIVYAVAKLHRICASVHILSSNPALASFAPLVPDIYPGTGPLGGIDAALAHSPHDWNLILPVDAPFIPTHLLERLVANIGSRHRISLVSVFGVPQPTVLLIHRDAAPYLTRAISRGEFKLLTALEAAARALAPPDAPISDQSPGILPVDERETAFWFANLNTPEDFAEAERRTDLLTT